MATPTLIPTTTIIALAIMVAMAITVVDMDTMEVDMGITEDMVALVVDTGDMGVVNNQIKFYLIDLFNK